MESVTHTHTRLTALFPGLPWWAGTRKVKPIWILLKQETVSSSGIRWAIRKSASRSRQITTPAPHHSSFFTGRMPFLPPNQQCQSTEGVSPEEEKKGYCGKDLQKRKVLSLEWKSEGVMDDESGQVIEQMEEGLGDSELERLVHGWWREARNWFHRRGEAYWKEQSVIHREDDVDGQTSVTKDEERVLQTFFCFFKKLFSLLFCFLAPSTRFSWESCPHLDVVHPGRAGSSSPACTWHCSLHYLFLQATPLFPHGLTIVC